MESSSLMGIPSVAPFAGARIEIFSNSSSLIMDTVAPFAGARIEITLSTGFSVTILSLPSRERGLKSVLSPRHITSCTVAPFAGARIEIKTTLFPPLLPLVAPFAGARIEIMFFCRRISLCAASLPSRERGLKYNDGEKSGNEALVAPFAGARIEMPKEVSCTHLRSSRSLRGSAD